MKRLSFWGVGPKMAVITLLYTGILLALHYSFPGIFTLSLVPATLIWLLSALLLCIGFPFLIISAKTIKAVYQQDQLYTKGVYRLCRHPLYASFIFFIAPGIVLLFRSWLLLTVPLFLYVVFRLLIRVEERYLSERYTADFIEYRQNTNLVFPNLCKLFQ